MVFSDEKDSSLASFLASIPADTLTYLKNKISKKDGSAEDFIDKILDENSNVQDSTDNTAAAPIQDVSPMPSEDNLDPGPSTSKASGSYNYPVVTLDEYGEDEEARSGQPSPDEVHAVDVQNTLATLQDVFPDLSPAFLWVRSMNDIKFLQIF